MLWGSNVAYRASVEKFVIAELDFVRSGSFGTDFTELRLELWTSHPSESTTKRHGLRYRPSGRSHAGFCGAVAGSRRSRPHITSFQGKVTLSTFALSRAARSRLTPAVYKGHG